MVNAPWQKSKEYLAYQIYNALAGPIAAVPGESPWQKSFDYWLMLIYNHYGGAATNHHKSTEYWLSLIANSQGANTNAHQADVYLAYSWYNAIAASPVVIADSSAPWQKSLEYWLYQIYIDISTAFDPASLPGFGLWLETRFITAADNDPIATWEDQTVNAWDHTGAGAERPTYKVNVLGTQAGFLFDGAGNLLRNNAFNSIAGVGAATIYLVFKATSTVTNQLIVSGPGERGQVQLLTNTLYSYAESGKYGSTAFVSLDPTVYAQVFDGSLIGNVNRLKLWINNVSQALAFAGVIPATLPAGNGNQISGLIGSALALYSGYVGALLVYAAAHTDVERERVQTYLANHYGATLS